MNCILGKKVGMLHLFDVNGKVYPATIIHCEPNKVVGIRTKVKDGYDAIQVGFDSINQKKLNQPKLGVFKKNNFTKFYKYLHSFYGLSGYTIGQEINVDQCFKVGEFVDVQGITKGHGFTGAIKKWNFKIGPLSHGAGYPHRYQGSIAIGRGGSQAQRVKKGQKMAGHYGCELVTIQNLMVLKINPLDNTIVIKGCVPGVVNQVLTIKSSVKKKKIGIAPNFITKAKIENPSLNEDKKASPTKLNESAKKEEKKVGK